ncbi:hypothetical protein DM01DRAFT_1339477 [Hesseltinella vesiculosa]|uniref:Protein SQS1 n=1 Tax=Hesseltinella vesiculosa TaxID=101127 RepID=A0A1X2G7R4_9FUNG|nr:hypothetical protein DM01DRAFT_1339477 [Hesseltinella vesiculosa]
MPGPKSKRGGGGHRGGRGNGRGRGRGRGRGQSSNRGRGRGGQMWAYNYPEQHQRQRHTMSSEEDLPLYGQFDSDTSAQSIADDLTKIQEQLNVVFAEPDANNIPSTSADTGVSRWGLSTNKRSKKMAKQFKARELDLIHRMSTIAVDDFGFNDGVASMDLLSALDGEGHSDMDDEELALIQDYIANTAQDDSDDDDNDDDDDDDELYSGHDNNLISAPQNGASSNSHASVKDGQADGNCLPEDGECQSSEIEDDFANLPVFLLDQQDLDPRHVRLDISDDDEDVDDEDEDMDIDDGDANELTGGLAVFADSDDDFDEPDGMDEMDEEAEHIFRKSLQDTLDQVPTGLKSGVRNMMYQERKQAKQKARAEKKQRIKEKKLQKKKKSDQQEKNTKVKGKQSLPDVAQLRKLDSRLVDFIRDEDITSLHFAPMEKNTRRQLHLLATAYNLKSKSIGTGMTRSPVVTKTDRTFLPLDRRYIERFIEEAQSTLNTQHRILRKHRMDSDRAFSPQGGHGKKHGKKEKHNNGNGIGNGFGKRRQDQQPPTSLHGAVVGSSAAPIDNSNLGHRMLAALGWSEGQGLGSQNEGITAPIEAVIRDKRRGLGT